jgi:hypothetical protein
MHDSKSITRIQTACFMGYVGGTEMLHSHYKGLASKTEADKFWALRPSPSSPPKAPGISAANQSE